MNLVAFHRLLIMAGIAFCFGFALYELRAWSATGGALLLLIAIAFLALGAGLVVYLLRLNRILGYDRGDREPRP